MQIQETSKHSFFIYIMSDELMDMGLKSSDLLYGSQAYRKLTATVLRELETYHGFSRGDLPLKIELSPGRDGDVYMEVSTFEDADEMDPRFCTFSAVDFPDDTETGIADGEPEDPDSEDNADEGIPDAGMMDDDAPVYTPVSRPHIDTRRLTPGDIAGSHICLTFSTYENLTDAVSSINKEHFSDIPSTLYMDTKSKALYMTLHLPKKPSIIYKDLMVLLEYADMQLLDGPTQAYLKEHCRRITSYPVFYI